MVKSIGNFIYSSGYLVFLVTVVISPGFMPKWITLMPS